MPVLENMKIKYIARDISWLSFNARVLQEAADPNVSIKQRIRFLGIFSNNLDEFFRVRVATLSRMIEFGKKSDLKMHVEQNPEQIMEEIRQKVLLQQNEFNRIWNEIIIEMKHQQVFIRNEKELNKTQERFVKKYFIEEVQSNIIPLMIEQLPTFPMLRDKSIYLAVQMQSSQNAYHHKFSIIEVPTKVINRFILLPSSGGKTEIILLEDVIRFNLKILFGHLEFNQFDSWIFKVTRDAEIDIDNDIHTNMVQKIQSGLRKRKQGKTVRLIYEKEMDSLLLTYLTRRLGLNYKDSVIPGERIHNFRDFMQFPDVFPKVKNSRKIIIHPALVNEIRVTDIVLKKDLLLCFPYHAFDSLINLLREAAIDEMVMSIQITAYRLANNSKIINALINAARNGKKVTVMLELRARFEEEANLKFKEQLEEEGIKVLIGVPNKKVHAKLCLICKKDGKSIKKYGFISTGNLNEQSAKVYSDFCLLTSNRNIMNDIELLFHLFEKPKDHEFILDKTRTLINCPNQLRIEMEKLIHFEIQEAKKGKKATIFLKMNSLSDEKLINTLYLAAKSGVNIQLIVRGIFCQLTELPKLKHRIQAISIVDEYLEHARVFYFHHGGKEKIFISSADWMLRNLDHRIEATCPIEDQTIKSLIKNILDIQWSDTIKARILDNAQNNQYRNGKGLKKIQSQISIQKFLQSNSLN